MKLLIKLCLSLALLNGYVLIDAKDIALCTVATGKYAFFVKNFIESARKHFMSNHQVKYFIFTDQVLPIEGDDITVVRWPHKKWPFSTMMRFKAYLENFDLLSNSDYIFACDVDAVFVDTVGDEILGKTVATLHPGYYKKNLMYNGVLYSLIEKNPASVIHLLPQQANTQYFAGGFYGGDKDGFKHLIMTCCSNIEQDLKNGIIAPWHDETHLNYFFLKNLPDLKLTPAYCYPEGSENNQAYRTVQSQTPKIVMLNKNHLQMRSHKQILDDREFVILIPSYNNIKYYKANLDSVYRQKYTNYRIIYIDDCSPDGTGEAVEQYVNYLGKQGVTTIIRNNERRLAMSNIYHNILAHCLDHEIVVMLDGDDALFDSDVLSKLNEEYKKNDVWFTYGDSWFVNIKRTCPWSKAINDIAIERNCFREWDGAATHLRTFYAWLFRRIQKEDLMLDGDFFKMTYDVAMFMPMLEMSAYHHKFIKESLYLYNEENPLNDHKINSKLQLALNSYIRNKLSKYKPLTKLEYFDKILNDCEQINTIEIAAILNDFITNVFKVYNQEDAFFILDKVPYLQSNFVNKSDLLEISDIKDYCHLQNYLLIKYHDMPMNFFTDNFGKKIYYYHDLLQTNLLNLEDFKFSQWLGSIISSRYKIRTTSIKQDVNALSINRITPLMIAASEGLLDIVEKLLVFGANKDIRAIDGKLAIDLARNKQEPWFKNIVELLSK